MTSLNGGQLDLGKGTNLNGNTVDFYYDDLFVNDSAFIGAGEIKLLVPNANGTTMQWTAGTGSSDWQEVDGIPPSVSQYVQSTAINDVALFNFVDTGTAGISGTINAVMFVPIAREVSTGTSSYQSRFISGASTTNSTPEDISTSSLVRGAQMFAVDPNTSAAWTTSALDAVQGGSVDLASNVMRLHWVGLHIDYTPSGAVEVTPASAEFDREHQSVRISINIQPASAEFDREIQSAALASEIGISTAEFDREWQSAALVVGVNIASAEFDREFQSVSVATGMVVNSPEFDREWQSVAITPTLNIQSAEFEREFGSVAINRILTPAAAEFDREFGSAALVVGVNISSPEFEREFGSASITGIAEVGVQASEYDREFSSAGLPATGAATPGDAEFDFEAGSPLLRSFMVPANTPKSRIKRVRECC